MIQNWLVENFKSIRKCDLEIKDLNVILGSNSVGKSSLIQSMVALAQMLNEQSDLESVQLIGSAQDLGAASTIIHRYPGKQKQNSMALEARVAASQSRSATCFRVELAVSKSNPNDFVIEREVLTFIDDGLETEIVRRRINLGPDQSRTSFSLKVGGIDLGEVAFGPGTASRGGPGDFIVLPWFEAFLLIAQYSSVQKIAGRKERLDALWRQLRSPLPTRELEKLGRLFLEQREESANVDDIAFLNLFLDEKRLGEDRVVARQDARENSQSITDEDLTRLLKALGQMKRSEDSIQLSETAERGSFRAYNALRIVEMDRVARQLSAAILHLGPLRVVAPSQQQNRRSPSQITPLGASGEFLAHTLMTRGDNLAEYPMPSGNTKRTTLIEALNSWIEFLGLEGRLRTELVPGLTTKITLGNRMFSQLGSGVSQILPVISLLLIGATQRNRLVVIEQPELHLHPNLQRKLADCLAIMATNGVRVLVETHSEYIVTRLRLLVARGELEASKVGLIFAEQKGKSRYGKYAEFYQGNLFGTGNSDYWPEGFHSDSLADRLELSAIQLMADD